MYPPFSFEACVSFLLLLPAITTSFMIKQYKCVLLQFWRSEFPKARCCVPSGDSREESMFFTFLVSRGHLPSLACGHFIIKAAAEHPLISVYASIITSPSLSLTLLPPSYKDPGDDTGLPQIIQDNLPIRRGLTNHNCEVPFAMEGNTGVLTSQVLRIRT